MATAPKRPLKRSRAQAAREMADLIMEHLSQYPEEERHRRIEAFGRAVDRISAARAKSAKSARSSGKTR